MEVSVEYGNKCGYGSKYGIQKSVWDTEVSVEYGSLLFFDHKWEQETSLPHSSNLGCFTQGPEIIPRVGSKLVFCCHCILLCAAAS